MHYTLAYGANANWLTVAVVCSEKETNLLASELIWKLPVFRLVCLSHFRGTTIITIKQTYPTLNHNYRQDESASC